MLSVPNDLSSNVSSHSRPGRSADSERLPHQGCCTDYGSKLTLLYIQLVTELCAIFCCMLPWRLNFCSMPSNLHIQHVGAWVLQLTFG